MRKDINKIANELSQDSRKMFLNFYNEYMEKRFQIISNEVGNVIKTGIKFSFYSFVFVSIFFSKPFVKEWELKNEFEREKVRIKLTKEKD